MSNIKIIFSRRIKEDLVQMGFKPIRRIENVKKDGFWAWEFEETPELAKAFDEIVSQGGKRYGR